jgi:hypothetical protein
VHDRIDFGIDGLSAGNRQVEQFTGTEFALADQASERDRVAATIFFKSHDLLSGMHRLMEFLDHFGFSLFGN